MEQFMDLHEIMEIRVPPARIVHPAFPFFILDSLKLPHKREMDPVIDSANALMSKYPGLQPSSKGVHPVERRSEGI
jgi:hypothetical protein